MSKFLEILERYNKLSTDYLSSHLAYKQLKAQKYLNLACPDPAIRSKDWKKPSDSIIESMLDTDEELNALKAKYESEKLSADTAEWQLEYLSNHKDF